MQQQQSQQQSQQYRYNRRSNFDELRKNETTSRAGLGWEAGEEERLLSMRLDKSSYDDIAIELKRTSRSIQTRLYQYVCKLVEVENDDESALIQKYDITYDDFLTFKTQRQEKLNKFESRKDSLSGGGGGGGDGSGGTKPYRKQKRFDKFERDDRGGGTDFKPLYVAPYENKNYSMRNELSTLRQEVYELRKIVNELRDAN
jgi:hypothetical protein